jgi:hypothetical protein
VNEEALLGQMGLILTQLRYARRAIEDIERSTARYNSYAFASALNAGAHFGEPPMFNGALKVYVNNIHDLEPGGGVGSLIQGLLGGIGGFFGNFIGGVPGGFLAGTAFPRMVEHIVKAVTDMQASLKTIGAIMERVGGSTKATAASPPVPGAAPVVAGATPTLMQVLEAFTALFKAAGTGNGKELSAALGGMDSQAKPLLTMVNTMLESIERVLNGVIILIPVAVGAIASLITKIDDIKLAILGVMQFILRNVFLVRGIVVVTIFETLAAIARMGAGLLQTLGTAVERILASAFSVAGSVLQLVVTGLGFVAGAIQRTVNALLPWVVKTVDVILGVIARSPIFGLLAHIIRILPALLPALNTVLNGSAAPPLSNEKKLNDLADEKFPQFGGPAGAIGGALKIDPMPDIAAAITSADQIAKLQESVTSAASSISAALKTSVDASSTLLLDTGKAFAAAAGPGEIVQRATFQARLGEVAKNADAVAAALTNAKTAAETQSGTGALREIANAYEKWLVTDGGLQSMVGEVNKGIIKTGKDGPNGLLGQITGGQNAARTVIGPRAVIDIDAIEITLNPATVPPPGGKVSIDSRPQGVGASVAYVNHLELQHDLEERGVSLDPGAAYTQVPV